MIDERHLEISWWGVAWQAGDKIAIYSYQAQDSYCKLDSKSLVEQLAIGNANWTWLRANTRLADMDNFVLNEECIAYYVAYIRQDHVAVACNCMKRRPNWMWQDKDRFGGMRLRAMMLPGTHDACSYDKYRGLVSENPATKYAITQGENLLTQLQFGIRYMDIRIMFRPLTADRFWTHHGAYVLRPLANDTALVRQFLQQSRDVVIFDIHGLDDFNGDASVHRELQQFLQNQFGQWMAPRNLTWNATLADFWAANKQLIVTYHESYFASGNPLLWTAVEHQWGDVDKINLLEKYLQSVMDRAKQGLLSFAWSAMAELTATAQDVALDKLHGLRNMADTVNRNVTVWFRERWANTSTIVATDFFLGNNIIDVAIAENQRRASTVKFPVLG